MEMRAAELSLPGGLEGSTEVGTCELHSVADPEYGYAEISDDARVAFGGVFVFDAGGSAGEDDAPGVERFQFVKRNRGENEGAVDTGFTNSAGDELGILRPEVDDDDDFAVAFVCRLIGGHGNPDLSSAIVDSVWRSGWTRENGF